MIVSLALLACAARGPEPTEDMAADSQKPAEVARPSGQVENGLFTDEDLGFQVPLLEGWVAEPGPSSGLMRVAMRHVPTGTRVEFWVFEGRGLTPRQREGCSWTFESEGRANTISDEVIVAMCTPEDPSERRVFGTVFAHQRWVMQIESHTPNDALVEGKEAADRVIRHLRW